MCTSVREASSPEGQRTPSRGGQLVGGQGQGEVAQPGRPVDRCQGAVGDFGQGVGGAVAGGAVIVGPVVVA